MSETEPNQELELFREEIREAIETTMFIITSGQDEGPFPVDPFTLELGDESLSELPKDKADVLKDELYKLAGINGETKAIFSYQSEDDEEISVSVFEVNQTDEEGKGQSFFVHEIKHPDGSLDWQLSAHKDSLL